MGVPTMIDLKDVGRVLSEFTVDTDQLNIDAKDSTNGHNEGWIKYKCENDVFIGSDIINDTFEVTGKQTKVGYTLSVAINSEVGVPLYGDGVITFDFSLKTLHWSMSGKADEQEWKFCNPDAALNVVIAGLKCMISECNGKNGLGGGYAEVITLFKNALEKDRKHIVGSVLLYGKESDCLHIPPAKPTIGDVEHVTWD